MDDETAEGRLAQSLKFVKVTVEDSTVDQGCIKHSGHLTDISVAMLIVEMKRNGLAFSNGHHQSEAK